VSARAVFREAIAAGLTLHAEADTLRWQADQPPSPALLARMKQRKAGLLEILGEFDERAGILEFDAGFSRSEAETRAMAEILERLDREDGP